jgi:hypothetical protein
MKRTAVTALVTALALCAGSGLRAEEHLVTREAVQSRLVEAADTRRADLAYLAPRVGPLQPVLHRLGAEELRDLARRAAALEADPRASGPHGALIALLVVLAVVLLAGMVLELG